MPVPKFSFVPERQIGTDPETGGYVVSVTAAGTLYFSPEVVRVYELKDAFIQMFADVQKKAIGWSIIDKGSLDNFKDTRQIKINAAQGSAILSIKKLLKKLGLEGKKFKKLPVNKYKSSLMEFPIYYIQLEKIVEQE